MTWTEELDEASVLATKKGYWHIVLFYLLCGLAAIPTSFLVFSQVFINATPKHWCAPPPALQGLDLPTDLLRNLTVPGEYESNEACNSYSLNMEELYTALDDYVIERSKIIRVGNIITTLKTKEFVPAFGLKERKEQLRRVQEAILTTRGEPTTCPHGWQFSTEDYKSTLVTEFSLVCDKDWLPRTSNTLFWVGSIFGNLFFGWFSDRYGRRPTILLMILLEVPLAIAASFPGNYWTYIALRVAGGLFFPALYQLPFILALELMPPSRRTYTGIVVGMLFASGMCLLALLAYLLRDWFYLSLATSLPFISLFGYYWLIPESPRWLVGRGRVADAEKVLRNLAKRNGITLPHGFLIELHKKIKADENTDLSIVPNGQIPGRERESYMERRISNMLPYKPDFRKINETNNESKESLDNTMTISIDASQKCRRDSEDHNDEMSNSEEFSALEPQQKPLPVDYTSSINTFRRKSIQIVNKILLKEEEDIVEKKRMDDQNSEGDCEASPLDVFRYPNIRKKFLILTFNWIALGVVYNSLSYNTPNLGVNDYLAFFIGGAVEIPSYFIALQCMERYGRRWVLCVFMSVGGVACLSCALVPEAWPWITVSLAMLGRLCAAASFSVFYVQIGELLPTVVRAQAMGAASVVAGIGLLTCPYIVSLASYSRSLPLIIMGVLSVVAGITSLFLPETLNQLLPQTLEDGESFGRDFKLLSCVNT